MSHLQDEKSFPQEGQPHIPPRHSPQEGAAMDPSLPQAGALMSGLRGRSEAGGSPTLLMPGSTPLTSQQHDQMADGSQAEQPGERWKSHG